MPDQVQETEVQEKQTRSEVQDIEAQGKQTWSEGEFLPTEWKTKSKMKNQCEQDFKWITDSSTVLPHYLNEEKIADKMRKNAILAPFEKIKESRDGQSTTIQCNTGCYYAVGVYLCHSWLVMQGQSPSTLEGQSLKVVGSKGEEDQSGAAEKYIVYLEVDGDKITVSFHNTTNKVQVQGEKEGVQNFTDNLLIPYFETNSDKKTLKITQINDMLRLDKRTRRNATDRKKLSNKEDEQYNEEMNDSILVTSTIHPDWLQVKPVSSPQQMENEEQSDDQLDGQVITEPCPNPPKGLVTDELSADLLDGRIQQLAPRRLTMEELSVPLPPCPPSSPRRLVREDHDTDRLESQEILEQSQFNITRCQELLSSHGEVGVMVVQKVIEGTDVQREEEKRGEIVVTTQSSQLLTSVLQTFPVHFEPGLLASLNSGILEVLQLESSSLPSQELDQQMTILPKTRVGPDDNWDGNNSFPLSISSTEEELYSDDDNDDSTGKTKASYRLAGREQTSTPIPEKEVMANSSKKAVDIVEVEESDESGRQNEVLKKLEVDTTSANKLEEVPDLTRIENAQISKPRLEQIRLEETSEPAPEVDAETPYPNLRWKHPTPLSQIQPELASLPEQDHATLGDYLAYICESVQTLIKMNSRTNQSLSSHASMIGSLQQRLNLVSDRQNVNTRNVLASQHEDETSHNSASGLEAEASHNPASGLEDKTHQTSASKMETELQETSSSQPAPQLSVAQKPNTTENQFTPSQLNAQEPLAQAVPRVEPSRISESTKNAKQLYKCNDCGFEARSLTRLDSHINVSHLRPNHFQALVPATLLVGDSHLKTLKKKWSVERALGGKGRLYTPGITYPSEDRAYCSTKDWPGAWHPENSMEDILPRLLKERSYSSAIILAPCNDISNLREFSSPEEQRLMCSQSSRNTITTIENALMNFPTLRKVVCVERPVRVDDMAELSQFSNSELRRLAQSSKFSSKIVVSSNKSELCRTEEEKVAIFKTPNTKGADGIHMRGEKGEEFFTNMLLGAAKMAGLSSSGLGGRRRIASRLDAQEPNGPRESHPSSGLESQWHRSIPATWAEVASNNCSSVFLSN